MPGKRFAILIASSKFPEEPGLTELRCPENDVDALAEVLRSPDLGQFSEVVVLKNAPSHEVLEQLEMLLHEARHEDLVLAYFSGHGKTSWSMSGRLFFATSDTRLKTPRSTSVSAAAIKAMFDDSHAKRKILLLDCCYSGAVGKEFTKGGIDGELQLLSGGRGTFIMTASTSVQVAFEKESDQHSLFTKHLLEGIRSGDADRNEDGWIDMAELHGYVREKMKEEGGQQEPLKWHLEGDGELIISCSGTESRAKRTQAAKKRLFNLNDQGYLPDKIFNEALQLISSNALKMTAQERECLLLIKQLGDDRISLGNFVERWVTTCFAPDPPPPSKPKLLLFMLAALFCATAGSGWYFFKDRIDYESLSAPPATGKVSVFRQTVSSLSQTKLQPIPKAKKGSAIGQYIDNDDGTVTDTKTGLMWKRCSEGLSGVNCEEGKLEYYTWDEAILHFENVAYAGYSDWRIPNIDELKTLVYCSNGIKDKKCNKESRRPTINQQAFPNTAIWYWSGSPHAGNSDGAWYVYFGYGDSYDSHSYYYSAVRLVRGGQ